MLESLDAAVCRVGSLVKNSSLVENSSIFRFFGATVSQDEKETLGEHDGGLSRHFAPTRGLEPRKKLSNTVPLSTHWSDCLKGREQQKA